jgi:hypothetical protein
MYIRKFEKKLKKADEIQIYHAIDEKIFKWNVKIKK